MFTKNFFKFTSWKQKKNSKFIKFKFFQLYIQLTWKQLIFLYLKITWVEKSWCQIFCIDPTWLEKWKVLTPKELEIQLNSLSQVEFWVRSPHTSAHTPCGVRATPVALPPVFWKPAWGFGAMTPTPKTCRRPIRTATSPSHF